MNYIKLNELAAQAMGWTPEKRWVQFSGQLTGGEVEVWDTSHITHRAKSTWNPCTDINDASELLNKVTGGEWTCAAYHPESSSDIEYDCFTIRFEGGANTEALAKTLCALRCAGIPESSITESMED